ncbi:MAG: response regulator [Myxococcota bacterium]|nr:response regulator [Myxococcota bacterium]
MAMRASPEHLARVVLIDDEERVRRDVGGWLSSLGYEVRSFDDARAALEALRREPADVVIAGGHVHDITAVDLCASIRGASASVPGIVGLVSAHAGAGGDDPFDVVVRRPCPNDALLTAISSVFRHAQR